MEQLKVEFPARKLTDKEKKWGIDGELIVATLDVLFFDGESWIPYTGMFEIPTGKPLKKEADIQKLKDTAEHRLWKWLAETMKAGEVEISGEIIKIYGVAAEPIWQEAL